MKQFNNQISRIFISALLLVCSGIFSFGQNQKNVVDGILKNREYADKWSTIESMRQHGLDDNKILDYLDAQAKAKAQQGKNTVTPLNKSGQLPIANAACSGLGVESGWGAWQAATGYFASTGTGTITITSTGLTPAAPRFNLTSGTGKDACTPGATAGDPIIISRQAPNHSTQIEILIAHLGGAKNGLGCPIAEYRPVGHRKGRQKRFDRRDRQLPGVVVRNRLHKTQSEALPQPFVGPKEKSSVPPNRSPERASKLVPAKW